MLPSGLSTYKPWQLDDGTRLFEYPSDESCRRRMPSGKRSIPGLKYQKLRMVCSRWSSLLHVFGVQQKSPLQIGDRFSNRVVLGHRVKRIHPVTPPERHDHGTSQGSLGLRVDHLTLIRPARPAQVPVPQLGLLRPRCDWSARQDHAAQRYHSNPRPHRPPGVVGFTGLAPRLSSSKRISSEVSGSSVAGKSCAALSIATKVLKASARSS